MRGSGTHPPTAALSPSPIHAKFFDTRKLREALGQRVFNSYALKILPHDLEKSPLPIPLQSFLPPPLLRTLPLATWSRTFFSSSASLIARMNTPHAASRSSIVSRASCSATSGGTVR